MKYEYEHLLREFGVLVECIGMLMSGMPSVSSLAKIEYLYKISIRVLSTLGDPELTESPSTEAQVEELLVLEQGWKCYAQIDLKDREGVAKYGRIILDLCQKP